MRCRGALPILNTNHGTPTPPRPVLRRPADSERWDARWAQLMNNENINKYSYSYNNRKKKNKTKHFLQNTRHVSESSTIMYHEEPLNHSDFEAKFNTFYQAKEEKKTKIKFSNLNE